ncbi:MAG: hypothetical protein QOH17_1659 [Pseudonocardiales bacterium]|nr:hypothetical protein [Pseudonocardiales bacterium]
MNATITPVTGTSQPLFVVFAGLVARAERSARTERRCLTGSSGLPIDRDLDRLLADLRSLPGAPADLARLASL